MRIKNGANNPSAALAGWGGSETTQAKQKIGVTPILAVVDGTKIFISSPGLPEFYSSQFKGECFPNLFPKYTILYISVHLRKR